MQLEVGDLQPGDSVRVSFRLPASVDTIDAFGTVIWSKHDQQGIQFTRMTNQNREGISRFIMQVEKS
jgi:hypothetical protein